MVVVYDVETLKGVFTLVSIDKDTNEIYKFVIHPERNDLDKLVEHLLKLKGQIGFNNISFDYPIIHFILTNYKSWKWVNPQVIITEIYNKAQELIEEQNRSEFAPTPVNERAWKIPQLDLFRMWHYNNSARATSLKALEISINFPNVMESSIHHSQENITLEQVEDILEYNLNDVQATLEFYKLSKDKIQLRKDIQKKYGLRCINFPDVKIGEQLLLNAYSNKTEQNRWEVRKQRTHRDKIIFKECILEKITYETKKFQNLLTKMYNTAVTETKGSFHEEIIFDGIKLTYGTGGIHGCAASGIYSPNENQILKSADVASLYPAMGIENDFYPEHLGTVFCEVFNNMRDERIQAKNSGEMTISDGLKLGLNGAVGKSNETNSFLYDPYFNMKITLNGQLLLTKLIEMLEVNIPGIKFIMVNTDGFEVLINKDQEELYYNICKEWEKFSKLILEFQDYEKMVIADVNNYSAKTTKGKYKYKGRFEIDKMVGNEKAYHKDNSFRIVPIALSKFFFENIPIEETIFNHQDIYDFCGRQKFKSDSYGETHTLEKISSWEYKTSIKKEQKNVRYYISNTGSTFTKKYTKGNSSGIHIGYFITVFNKYIKKPMKEYDLDYRFYIESCNKEIRNILNDNQLKLF